MIREPAAWVLVDGIEEIFRCAEQSYSRDRRSKRFEIFGKKLLPEFLSQPHQKHGSRSGSNVAFDPRESAIFFWMCPPGLASTQWSLAFFLLQRKAPSGFPRFTISVQ